MMVDLTARGTLLQTLRDEAAKIRNGAYYAKRGAINWVEFPFEKYGRAMAIMQDDGDLLRHLQTGFANGTFSIEIMARMPQIEDEDRVEIDDVLQDEILEDGGELMKFLITARDKENDPVAFKVDQNAISFIEVHDATMRVQGIVITFSATY